MALRALIYLSWFAACAVGSHVPVQVQGQSDDLCANVTCLNQGVCQVTPYPPHSAHCVCRYEYTGARCQLRRNVQPGSGTKDTTANNASSTSTVSKSEHVNPKISILEAASMRSARISPPIPAQQAQNTADLFLANMIIQSMGKHIKEEPENPDANGRPRTATTGATQAPPSIFTPQMNMFPQPASPVPAPILNPTPPIHSTLSEQPANTETPLPVQTQPFSSPTPNSVPKASNPYLNFIVNLMNLYKPFIQGITASKTPNSPITPQMLASVMQMNSNSLGIKPTSLTQPLTNPPALPLPVPPSAGQQNSTSISLPNETTAPPTTTTTTLASTTSTIPTTTAPPPTTTPPIVFNRVRNSTSLTNRNQFIPQAPTPLFTPKRLNTNPIINSLLSPNAIMNLLNMQPSPRHTTKPQQNPCSVIRCPEETVCRPLSSPSNGLLLAECVDIPKLHTAVRSPSMPMTWVITDPCGQCPDQHSCITTQTRTCAPGTNICSTTLNPSCIPDPCLACGSNQVCLKVSSPCPPGAEPTHESSRTFPVRSEARSELLAELGIPTPPVVPQCKVFQCVQRDNCGGCPIGQVCHQTTPFPCVGGSCTPQWTCAVPGLLQQNMCGGRCPLRTRCAPNRSLCTIPPCASHVCVRELAD